MTRATLCCAAILWAALTAGCGSAGHGDLTGGSDPGGSDPGGSDPGGSDPSGDGVDGGSGSASGGSDGGAGPATGADLGPSTPPPTASGIRIIVEPSDKGQALVAAIAGATKSVHMTMYLLTNEDVIDALLAQRSAGHEVKVVLNQTFFDSSTSNAAVYDRLRTEGVSVAWAPSTFTYTHEKCVIVDGREAWIMTMNATQSSPTSNREYLAVDTNAADVAEAEAIFAADFAGQSITPAGDLVVSPTNSRARIVALLAGAEKTIDMEAEELSDYQVVDALAARADAGVAVRIVLSDETPTSSQTSAVATLKTHGVRLVSVHSPDIHAKAAVVDGASAYVGSENFTTNSLVYNRELGVIFSAASEVQKVATTIAGDFAAGTAL